MKVTSWSFSGPPRTFTLSVLRLTNRGTGRLLVGSWPARAGAPASVSSKSAASAANACVDTAALANRGRAHGKLPEKRNVTAIRPTNSKTRDNLKTPRALLERRHLLER